jgi:hypothetical protein
MKPEEMPIVAIIPDLIVIKGHRTNIEPANHMPVMRVVIIIFVVSISIRIIASVIITPAIGIPTVTFPTPVPVFLLVIVVIPVIIPVRMIVVHFSRTVFIVPVPVTSTIIPAGAVSSVGVIDTVKIAVITHCSAGISSAIVG